MPDRGDTLKNEFWQFFLCLAVAAFLVPLCARAARRSTKNDGVLRIVVSNADQMKASLEAASFDVLETNSADSNLRVVICPRRKSARLKETG